MIFWKSSEKIKRQKKERERKTEFFLLTKHNNNKFKTVILPPGSPIGIKKKFSLYIYINFEDIILR